MTGRSGFILSFEEHGPKNFRHGESSGPNRAEPRNFPGCGISAQFLTTPRPALC
jgi:hypothetical protein